jgi:starch synthase
LQQRGMAQNFSWVNSAKEYVKMYGNILGLPEEELFPSEPKKEMAET